MRLANSLGGDVVQKDALYGISCVRCVVCFVAGGWFSRCGFRGFGPVCVHKEPGSHVHFCPRPCSSTSRWARLSTHRHKKTTLTATIRPPPVRRKKVSRTSAIRALIPSLAVVINACASSPWDRAVSRASHMLQDMVISQALPPLSTASALLGMFTANLDPEMVDKMPSHVAVFGVYFETCYAPPSDSLHPVRHWMTHALQLRVSSCWSK